MNKETTHKINHLKYQIVQNLLETNYGAIDEHLFYTFVESISAAFLGVDTYFKEEYTPSDTRVEGYLSVFSNYCEVCKEVEKYVENAQHVQALIGILMPMLTSDTHESIKFVIEIQKDSIMKLNHSFLLKLLGDLSSYDENVYMIYMSMLSYFDDVPERRAPLIEYLPRLTSQNTHNDIMLSLSILQYQEELGFDGNRHAEILYKTCKEHKKDSDDMLFSLLERVFEKEHDICETIHLDYEPFLKYVWSLMYIAQVEDNHARRDLLFQILAILVDRYTVTVTESCLTKLILEKIYTSLKEPDETCDVRRKSIESIFFILKEHMNMYNYLATLVTLDDVSLFSEYLNTSILTKKINAFSGNDTEVDILTSQPIIHPCSIKNGDQTIALDRATIEHLILETGQNPFTREPLTFESLRKI
jgi:hypothetical protein